MPAVRRIAKGTVVGVMRGDDERLASRGEHAMDFFHGSDDVRDVLNDVDRAHFAEGVVGERPGEAVEIGDQVSASVDIAIDANGAGIFVDTASDVEDGQSFERRRGRLDAAIVAGIGNR